MAARSARIPNWVEVFQSIPKGFKRVHVNNGFWDFVISARTPESGHQLVKRVTVNLKDCRPDGIELGSYECKLIGWGRLVGFWLSDRQAR
jgi:hypothetical protein